MWLVMASRTFFRASSTVSPQDYTRLILETFTPYTLFSSLKITTGISISNISYAWILCSAVHKVAETEGATLAGQ